MLAFHAISTTTRIQLFIGGFGFVEPISWPTHLRMGDSVVIWQGANLVLSLFAGTIPPELGNLGVLKTLALRDNALTGEFSEASNTEFPIFAVRETSP